MHIVSFLQHSVSFFADAGTPTHGPIIIDMIVSAVKAVFGF